MVIVDEAASAKVIGSLHRIITKKGGPIKGFVKGTYVLEKTQNYVSRRMIALFKKEVEAIQKKHD